jgi:hypothetical protein
VFDPGSGIVTHQVSFVITYLVNKKVHLCINYGIKKIPKIFGIMAYHRSDEMLNLKTTELLGHP